MKRLFSAFLALVACTTMLGTAYAVQASASNVEEDFAVVWTTLRESGDLTVSSEGLLYVNENNKMTEAEGYDKFLDLVDVCNESIREGILTVDAESVEVVSVFQPTEERIPYGEAEKINQGIDANIEPLNAAHGCSVQACNLLNMCRINYNTLEEYYMDMLELVLINPNLSPWGATVGFWVSKVEPDGDWDYKVQPGFAPYDSQFCCYFNSNFNHVTSEYIGNFNFGYTGSYLFGLDALHTGSFVVAKFDPADKEDWPAIDAGYECAPNT